MTADFTLLPNLRDTALRYVTYQYDVTEDELRSRMVKRHIVQARALFIWAIRHHSPSTPFDAIAQWLGHRHTNAVARMHRKAVALRLTDQHFSALCANFEQLWFSRQLWLNEMEVPNACQ